MIRLPLEVAEGDAQHPAEVVGQGVEQLLDLVGSPLRPRPPGTVDGTEPEFRI